MDRRTILALVLVVLVILLTPRLFPGRRRPGGIAGDTVGDTVRDTVAGPQARKTPAQSERSARDTQIATPVATVTPSERGSEPVSERVDTIVVAGGAAAYRFTSLGGTLLDVRLGSFKSLGPSDGPLFLRSPESPLLRFRVIAAQDTVRFDQSSFTYVAPDSGSKSRDVAFVGAVGGDSLALHYAVVPDSFLVHVIGRLSARLANAASGLVVVDLPATLESFEADSVDDQRHLAFAFKPSQRDAEGIPFGKLDPGERRIGAGPLDWIALKDKYFIIGLLTARGDSSLVEFSATGMARATRTASHAQGTAVLRTSDGAFTFDVYSGPQQWKRLQSLGRGFEDSNPYGGFLRPVVQPFATIVLRILLWMHETLRMSYGWVLVVFGIVVRLVLWPLNQSAMRSSLKMQRIQPELNELQKRYKSDPQKLQSEMMRVYRDHGMSPFSMFSGCLPMLLPMPVLFALFFVFQNTIEFRAVSFMWLHDISQKDPYYVLPILMGISMYVLTWIGSRNTPPNPQTKMMGYVFPVMMTFLLANLAAGLNLYYAIQNVAALPQQWFIASERARAAAKKK